MAAEILPGNPALNSWLQDGSLQLGVWLGTILLLHFLGNCRPSKITFYLVSVPVLGLALGFIWPPITELAGTLNLLLCLLLIADRYFLSVLPADISAQRQVSTRLSIQEPMPVRMTLSSRQAQPVRISVADQPPQNFRIEQDTRTQLCTLRHQEPQTLTYRIQPIRRGPAEFGDLYLSYSSRLGLLWLQKKVAARQPVFVTPDLRHIRKMRVRFSRALGTGELQKRKMGAEGTEFDGLRNYATGDDFRKMDWKASARLDTPIVRTLTHQVEQPILVLIDAGRKMQMQIDHIQLFDRALNSALGLGAVALDRGDQVAITAFDQTLLTPLRFGSGQRQLNRLMDDFGTLGPSMLDPDYESVMLQVARQLNRRTLIVIFTDLIDPVASRSLSWGLQAFSKNHLLVIVTPQPAALQESALAIPVSAEESYEKAVTLDLLQLREKTLLTLSKTHHATLIDTPLEKMSESLIDHYLAVKLKNRI